MFCFLCLKINTNNYISYISDIQYKTMKKLLFTFIYRSLKRQKLYTLINIAGLTIGILSFAMIMLYLSHEDSFDNFHKKRDRIYRLTSSTKERKGAVTPYPWGVNLAHDFPEVENYSTLQILSLTTKLGDEVFAEEKVVAADSTFFQLFDFPTIIGNTNEFLHSPNKLIVTPQTALRYFKKENPIGEKIELNLYGTFVTYEIEGVVDCPQNSHLQFDFLLPIHLVKRYSNNAWGYEHWRLHFVYTYLLLAENVNPDAVKPKFKDFLLIHAGEEVSETYTPALQALEDIYQKSNLTFDFQPRGNEENANILKLVALGILLIAMINFINISTAQSLRRAKEVGLKKILGARRKGLILQFIGESTLLALAAFTLTIIIVILILPYFNDFTGKDLVLREVFTSRNMGFISGLTLFTGIVSGFYPAMLLSSYKPISMLGSSSAGKSKGILARKVLVVLQFVLAAILLVATGVIYEQVRYMQSKDLGFDKEQVLVINDGGEISAKVQKTQLLRDQLTSQSTIHTVSSSSTYPGKQTWAMRYQPEGQKSEENYSFSTFFADHDFLKTYGVEMVRGRDFNRDIQTDSSAFLINEAAVNFLAGLDPSWADNPLEKKLTLLGFNVEGNVIGVFRDFHYESLKSDINPLVVHIFPNNFNCLQMRLSVENLSQTLDYIERKWKQLFPDVPYQYSFVDQEFAGYFETDKQLGELLRMFTILSITVAMLGLFGLASFLAFDKSKEMSIRKVIGASEEQLFGLLSWVFLKLVLIANFIALPISYILMDHWLSGFAYRDSMPITVFLLAVGAILFVTFVTVAYHAIRTARVDPVKVLAQE